MSIKLQLDKEALERLIGGDSRAEVEIRSGIVQNFAKRHLKGVATEELLAQSRRYVEAYVKKELGLTSMWATWDPPQVIKDAIAKEVRAKVDGLVVEAVDAAFRELSDNIKVRVEGMAYRVERALVEKQFESRVQTEVNRRLEIAAKAGGVG